MSIFGLMEIDEGFSFSSLPWNALKPLPIDLVIEHVGARQDRHIYYQYTVLNGLSITNLIMGSILFGKKTEHFLDLRTFPYFAVVILKLCVEQVSIFERLRDRRGWINLEKFKLCTITPDCSVV